MITVDVVRFPSKVETNSTSFQVLLGKFKIAGVDEKVGILFDCSYIYFGL